MSLALGGRAVNGEGGQTVPFQPMQRSGGRLVFRMERALWSFCCLGGNATRTSWAKTRLTGRDPPEHVCGRTIERALQICSIANLDVVERQSRPSGNRRTNSSSDDGKWTLGRWKTRQSTVMTVLGAGTQRTCFENIRTTDPGRNRASSKSRDAVCSIVCLKERN